MKLINFFLYTLSIQVLSSTVLYCPFYALFALEFCFFFLNIQTVSTEKDAAAMQWYLRGKAEQTAESLIINPKTEPRPL
jgi:hypothetical protein